MLWYDGLYCFIEIYHVFIHGHLVLLGVYVLLYGAFLIDILVDKVAQCNFVCNVYLQCLDSVTKYNL